MKYRIFYAPQVFGTWEKLFVLTSDGHLYCEYLFRFTLNKIELSGFNYDNFAPTNYSWGKGIEGNNGIAFTNYQSCEKELSWDEYIKLKPSPLLSGYNSTYITRQIKWIENYLTSSGLSSKDWDESIFNRLKNIKN
jgi:hypothetical protein